MLSSKYLNADPFPLNKSKTMTFLSKSSPDLINSLNSAEEKNRNMKELEVLNTDQMEKHYLLKMQKESLEKMLNKKLDELRQLCITEAELTGVLSADFPEIPGKEKPRVKKRIGTEFILSSKLLQEIHVKTIDAVQRLQLEIEVQEKIKDAAFRLSEDKLLPKSVRKKHRQDYQKQIEKLKQLEETLIIYERETEGKRISSKTTDDVENCANIKENISNQTYSTLPHRPHHQRQQQQHNQDSHHLQQQQQQQHLHYSNSVPAMMLKRHSDIKPSSLDRSSTSLIVPNSLGREVKLCSTRLTTTHAPDFIVITPPGQISLRPYKNNIHVTGSTSPSTIESSDWTSSCSSSQSSLHFNNPTDPYNSPTTHDSNRWRPTAYTDDQVIISPSENSAHKRSNYRKQNSSTHQIIAPPQQSTHEYSSHLPRSSTNIQYGSLDRKRKSNNGRHSKQEEIITEALPTTTPTLTELTPSRFGSKRESTVDSQDSMFVFFESQSTEKSLQQTTKNFDLSPISSLEQNDLIGRFIAPSSGKRNVHIVIKDDDSMMSRTTDSTCNRTDSTQVQQDTAYKKSNRRLNTTDSANNNKTSSSSSVIMSSEMSDMEQYRETLRHTQKTHQKLCSKSTPPTIHELTNQRTDKNKNKLKSVEKQNNDAIDALFQHHEEQFHSQTLPLKRNSGNKSLSTSSSSSSVSVEPIQLNHSSSSLSSSGISNPNRLRFIKVKEPFDNSEIDFSSTLV